jgi:hypothetical protein
MYSNRPQHLNATRRPASIRTFAQETAETVLTRASIFHQQSQPCQKKTKEKRQPTPTLLGSASELPIKRHAEVLPRETIDSTARTSIRQHHLVRRKESQSPSLRRYSGQLQDFRSRRISKYSQERLATVLTRASTCQHHLVSRDNRLYPTSPRQSNICPTASGSQRPNEKSPQTPQAKTDKVHPNTTSAEDVQATSHHKMQRRANILFATTVSHPDSAMAVSLKHDRLAHVSSTVR